MVTLVLYLYFFIDELKLSSFSLFHSSVQLDESEYTRKVQLTTVRAFDFISYHYKIINFSRGSINGLKFSG